MFRIGIVGTGVSDIKNSTALLDDYLDSIAGEVEICYFIVKGTKSTDSVFRLLQADIRNRNDFELWVPEFTELDWLEEASKSASHIGTFGEHPEDELNQCDSVLFFYDEAELDLMSKVTVPAFDITNGMLPVSVQVQDDKFNVLKKEEKWGKKEEEPVAKPEEEKVPTTKDLEKAVIDLVTAATAVLEALKNR